MSKVKRTSISNIRQNHQMASSSSRIDAQDQPVLHIFGRMHEDRDQS